MSTVTPRRRVQRSDDNAAEWERRFEIPMLLVAALVIPSMLLDQAGVTEPWRGIGMGLNWLIWSAFVLELAVMLVVSPSRWDYVRRNPLDAVIVLATPPFLTSVVNGIRLLRLVRLTRLMRLEPLVRWVFAAVASSTPPSSPAWWCSPPRSPSRSSRTPATSTGCTGR